MRLRDPTARGIIELNQYRPFLHGLASVEIDSGHAARRVGGQQHFTHGLQATDSLQFIANATGFRADRRNRQRRHGVVFSATAADGAPGIEQAEDHDKADDAYCNGFGTEGCGTHAFLSTAAGVEGVLGRLRMVAIQRQSGDIRDFLGKNKVLVRPAKHAGLRHGKPQSNAAYPRRPNATLRNQVRIFFIQDISSKSLFLA